MKEEIDEKERLFSLFKIVKEKALENQTENFKLRIINPKGYNSNHPKYRPPGRTTIDYAKERKIIILNKKITKNMSDLAVRGLIAHEIAHFFSKNWEELTEKKSDSISSIFEKSEEEADNWAKSKGFEEEIKAARSEVSSLKES